MNYIKTPIDSRSEVWLISAGGASTGSSSGSTVTTGGGVGVASGDRIGASRAKGETGSLRETGESGASLNSCTLGSS